MYIFYINGEGCVVGSVVTIKVINTTKENYCKGQFVAVSIGPTWEHTSMDTSYYALHVEPFLFKA